VNDYAAVLKLLFPQDDTVAVEGEEYKQFKVQIKLRKKAKISCKSHSSIVIP
jgi:hypothetical protein